MPGLGDSVREPQWIWAGAGGALVALAHSCFFGRAEWGKLAGALPSAAWAWLLFLVALAFRGRDPAGALAILFFPALVLLGALALFLSPVRLREKRIFATLAVITLLQALFGVLQILDLDPIFVRANIPNLGKAPPAGFAGQHTMFGLLMAWLAALWLFRRNWGLFLVCVAFVGATRSAFALASLVFGFLWFGYCQGYRKTAAAIGLGALVVGANLFISSDSSADFFFHNGRLLVWVLAVKGLMLQPWLGYGIGAMSRELPRYLLGLQEMRWEEAHNEWIEYAFNTGIVGLLFLLPVAWALARRIRAIPVSPEKELALGTLVVIGINTLGNFPLQLAPFATLAIYALAWLLVEGGKNT